MFIRKALPTKNGRAESPFYPAVRPQALSFLLVHFIFSTKDRALDVTVLSELLERRRPVSAVSLLTLWAMQPCCEPHGIGTGRA